MKNEKELFFKIEEILSNRKKHQEKINCKDAKYRKIFKFKGGIEHILYFNDKKECEEYEDYSCGYNVFGQPYILSPILIKIQKNSESSGKWENIKK